MTISMDVSASSLSTISQAQTRSKIDVAVAKKTLDAQKQAGDAAVQLLASVANNAPSKATAGKLDVVA
jgi:hypothetical protein